MECVLCRILRGEMSAQKVHEDDRVVALLDVNPVAPGHTLVLPREHVGTWTELSDELAATLAVASKAVAKAVLAATGAQGYNLLGNNQRCSGQAIPHVHLHVIPRREADGVKFNWPSRPADAAALELQAERIRQAMRSN